jgi:hypothetical protein
MKFKRRKVIKTLWIILSFIVVLSMISWTVMAGLY